MLKDDDLGSLGFLSLSCLYIFYTAGSLFATSIIKWLKTYNFAFAFVGIGYTCYVACFLLPAYMAKKIAEDPDHIIPTTGLLSEWPITICFLITSAICGVAKSILGVARGAYISKAACEQNKGFYNSYVLSWGLAASLIGNPLSSVIIRDGGING